jgi:hypothetical protein
MTDAQAVMFDRVAKRLEDYTAEWKGEGIYEYVDGMIDTEGEGWENEEIDVILRFLHDYEIVLATRKVGRRKT